MLQVELLQKSIILYCGRTINIKSTMQELYASIGEHTFSTCKKPGLFKKIAEALCFFHGVLCMRSQYSTAGWISDTSLTESAFNTCLMTAKNYISACDEKQIDINFADLCKFLCEVVSVMNTNS